MTWARAALLLAASASGNFATAAAALAVAVCAASFSWFIGRRDTDCRRRVTVLEQEVEQLRRERALYREHNELVVGALLGLLPEPSRLELLRRLDERTPAQAGLYYGETHS